MTKKFLLPFIIVGLLFLFLYQNHVPVETSLLFWKVSLPRTVWLGSLLAVGFFLGYLLHFIQVRRRDQKKAFSDTQHAEKLRETSEQRV